MEFDCSVLIPCWNCETTLTRAIDSALSQSGVTVQVSLCDDGSTDGTFDILAALPKSDRIHTFVHADNLGQCHALNSAADYAVGRYIIELDADDYFEENTLRILVQALDAAPEHVGFAYGCVQYHGALNYFYQPRPFKRGDFYTSFPSLYPFLYRREAWDAGCRYTPHLEKDGRALSIQDWDMALQLMEYMRYDGLALRDTLVLHYTYAEGGTVGHELKANSAALMPAFKARFPKVTVEAL